MLKFFADKNVSSFCSAKATHIFSAKNIRILYIESVIFLPAHPESRTHIFCFGTHILNLSESQDSQSYSGKSCNGHNDFLVGLTLYSPSESWDA